MRRLLVLIALVVGVLTPTAGAFGASATADKDDSTGLGVRLVDAPVATRDNPRASVYIIDHVAPGTLIKRRIEVTNDTGKPADVTVYAAAAGIKDGAFTGLEGETPNELSTWTTISRPSLDLADNGTSMVEVEIDVPADAAPGEQYAVVWAQVDSGADKSGGVTQVSRVGIRVYLSVGPGGEPASDFEITSLTAARDDAGTPMVQAQIHNSGGRALDLSGELTLTNGPGGLSAGPFPVSLGTTLAVDQSEAITVALDTELPNGPWKADIEVVSGLLNRHAKATITFPDEGTGDTVPAVQEDEQGTALLWWIGLAALGIALLTLGFYLVARARRTTPRRLGRNASSPA